MLFNTPSLLVLADKAQTQSLFRDIHEYITLTPTLTLIGTGPDVRTCLSSVIYSNSPNSSLFEILLYHTEVSGTHCIIIIRDGNNIRPSVSTYIQY